MINTKSIYFAFLLLIASSLFWSGNFFTGKIASLYDLTPFKLSFLRWSLAFLLLLPFTYRKIVEDFDKRIPLGTYTLNNRDFWENNNFNESTFQSYFLEEWSFL